MKREDLFERLSPPPGGLADLRERMDRRPNFLPRYIPIAAVVAAAAAVLFLSPAAEQPPDLIARAHAKGDGAEVVLGLAPAQRDPVVLADDERGASALERVPTSRADVAFYWVGSTR